MNYFNDVTNEMFIEYFIKELYSKTEFVQYDDPDELFDLEQVYGKHIQESQDKMLDYILESTNIPKENFTPEIVHAYIEKRKELFPIIIPKIEEYIRSIKVDYI